MNAAIHGGWRSFSKEKGPNGGGRRCCDERRVIFSRAYTSDCPGCIAANSIRDEPLTTKCFVSVADDSTEVDKANFSWMNVHILLRLHAITLASTPLQFSIDECTQVSVENILRIRLFIVRTVILHSVVIKNIGTNLCSPSALDLAALGFGNFRVAFFLSNLLQLRHQHSKRLLSIL